MPSKHNQVWGSDPTGDGTEDITLPSGQTCTARKVSIEGLIEMGILADADSLTALVEKHTRKVKGGKGPDGTKINQMSLISDTEAMKAIIALADKALPVIVVDPPVSLHYSTRTVGKTTVTKKLTAEERAQVRLERNQPNLIFTDVVPLEDKMHLFNWGAGGVSSFLSPGGESTADVGGLGNGSGHAKPTKRNPRDS